MGQQANSGRHASLDDKKRRAAGRQQNDPANEAISGREEAPPVGGAFGRQGPANRRGGTATSVAEGNTDDSQRPAPDQNG